MSFLLSLHQRCDELAASETFPQSDMQLSQHRNLEVDITYFSEDEANAHGWLSVVSS